MPRSAPSTEPALVVFDVDGTLTRSTVLNGTLYARALEEVFGFRDPRTDWSGYRETTDPGVLRQLFRARHHRDPTADERRGFRDRFQALLREALENRPGAIGEVPGARALLASVASHPGWRGAVASGAFEGSVLLKLRSAGLSLATRWPRATGDDARQRDAILRLAIRRARVAAGGRRFSRVVLVGDAPWDARAARALGLPFLGVGAGDAAEALLRAGAFDVVPNFIDTAAVFDALASARRGRATVRRHPNGRAPSPIETNSRP